MSRIEDLEERIAHLTRMVEDLSDIVRDQGGQIDRLSHRLHLLMQREADQDDAPGAVFTDQRPPHW